jgi:hypothetical protein
LFGDGGSDAGKEELTVFFAVDDVVFDVNGRYIGVARRLSQRPPYSPLQKKGTRHDEGRENQ